MTCTRAGHCRKTFETLFNVVARVALTRWFPVPSNLCTNGSDPASICIDDTTADLSTSRQTELLRSFLAQLPN